VARQSRIDQDGHAGDRWDGFFEQLEAFARELDRAEFHSCEVATRPRQVGDKSLFHHIVLDPDDNGDRGGCLLRGLGRLRRVRPEHIRCQVDELGREGREPRELPFGIAGLNDDVLPLDVAEVAHPLSEAGGADLGRRRGARIEQRHPRQVCRSLRCGEARRHEAPHECDQQPEETEP